MESYDVAIVGGGIAGLYAAYRLRQAWKTQRKQLQKELSVTGPQLKIVILEQNPIVLGGRIRTVDIPHPEGSVRAELGAMRITTRHLLARHLFRELKVQTIPFEGQGFSEHYYLRGKHFDADDVRRDKSTFPYTLEEKEKGKTPGALVEFVLDETLRELSVGKVPAKELPQVLLVLEKLRNKTARGTLSHNEWLLIQEYGLLTGNVELSKLGMWNLIHHYLSPEAASFVEGGFGYESIIGNWNVSDAIPWFIADFSPSQGYEAIVGSFSHVVEELENRLGTDNEFRCDIFKYAQVKSLSREGDRYNVHIRPKTEYVLKSGIAGPVVANAVFLALPKRPLEHLDIAWLNEDEKREWDEKLASVRSHRLVKIVQAYRDAWWRPKDAPPGAASRTFTDLPLRQVYYLDREWLAERGRYRDQEGKIVRDGSSHIGGMIVAYLDGHYASFWRFITAVQRIHDLHKNSKAPEAKELEKRRWFGDRIWGWNEKEPDPNYDVTKWDERKRVLHLYFNRYGLYARASAKMKHALEWLHKRAPGSAGAVVPDPVAGAYTFWDDFSDDSLVSAGWHTWESGVSSADRINDMIAPFDNHRVFVCGEAYSSEQGWIEGALKSVELIMNRLGILLPDETTDPQAPQHIRERSERMRDHVGCVDGPRKRRPTAKHRRPSR